MKITAPGIYYDFDGEAYFADPCPEPSFSQSIGKVLIDSSPMHARVEHPRLTTAAEEDEEAEKYTKAKAIGNAAHAMMIGRGKTIAILDFPDFKKAEAKQAREDAEAQGKSVILQKHWLIADEMVRSARRQLSGHEANQSFTHGKGEVVIAWQEDGFWFRCMIDWLHDDLLLVDDFKTTALSIAPHVLGLRAEDAGWHIQAAMIERGLDALDPKNAGRRKYRFTGQEQARPYAINVMEMDEYWLTMGRKKLAAGVARWKYAMANNEWHGYPNKILTPEYPGFRETQWLTRETNDEFAPLICSPSTAPMLTDLSGG